MRRGPGTSLRRATPSQALRSHDTKASAGICYSIALKGPASRTLLAGLMLVLLALLLAIGTFIGAIVQASVGGVPSGDPLWLDSLVVGALALLSAAALIAIAWSSSGKMPVGPWVVCISGAISIIGIGALFVATSAGIGPAGAGESTVELGALRLGALILVPVAFLSAAVSLPITIRRALRAAEPI